MVIVRVECLSQNKKGPSRSGEACCIRARLFQRMKPRQCARLSPVGEQQSHIIMAIIAKESVCMAVRVHVQIAGVKCTRSPRILQRAVRREREPAAATERRTTDPRERNAERRPDDRGAVARARGWHSAGNESHNTGRLPGRLRGPAAWAASDHHLPVHAHSLHALANCTARCCANLNLYRTTRVR